MWKDNNCEGNWDKFGGGANTLGSETANWMEENDAEASCAAPTLGNGEGSWATIDNSIMAYGWNNEPFGIDGRSGDWLDGCGQDSSGIPCE